MKIVKRESKQITSAADLTDTVYAGAYLDAGNYVHFNWKHDNYRNDIIALATDTSGEFDSDGVRYCYGYTYLPKVSSYDKKKFRDYIKYLGIGEDYINTEEDDEVEEFVVRSLGMFDRKYDVRHFGATIHIVPTSKSSIVGTMARYIAEWSDGAQMSFELVKRMYSDVEFDNQKAFEKLMESERYSEDEANDLVDDAVRTFEKLKKSGKLFEMKKFVPRELRDGFSNYLRFKSARDRWAYQNLQGVDVLIYDDFMTSGATVKEIVRYLRSIHDENTLTVFVLIKQ